MAAKLKLRYTVEPAAPHLPGKLCLWLRQKPVTSQIIVRKTRSRARVPTLISRTAYRSSCTETLH